MESDFLTPAEVNALLKGVMPEEEPPLTKQQVLESLRSKIDGLKRQSWILMDAYQAYEDAYDMVCRIQEGGQ